MTDQPTAPEGAEPQPEDAARVEGESVEKTTIRRVVIAGALIAAAIGAAGLSRLGWSWLVLAGVAVVLAAGLYWYLRNRSARRSGWPRFRMRTPRLAAWTNQPAPKPARTAAPASKRASDHRARDV